MLLVLKVIISPFVLIKIVDEIKVNENLGFYISPQLSLLITLFFTYLSWVFSGMLFSGQDTMLKIFGSVSFTMMLAGMFIMVFRMKALAQIIGLLAMENGIFLLASSAAGGMPFLVEMAIFFDIFVCVIILGIFVYRINKLFVSIDISKLTGLKG
jgi:hydrogenase-4 component E